jgi:hypothetical protein
MIETALERMTAQTRGLAKAECEFADDPPCYGCSTCYARETVKLLDAESEHAGSVTDAP